MRYKWDESTYILSVFDTGATVTIDVYRLSDNVKVVNAAATSEIWTTWYFKYSFSQTITSKTEYLWIATDWSLEHSWKIVLWWYVEAISEAKDWAKKAWTQRFT